MSGTACRSAVCLACEGAVIPYAVGVDIACRMKLSVLDLPAESLVTPAQSISRKRSTAGRDLASASSTRSGNAHAVMDRDWSVTRITREKKDTAWKQLGTSGSGNHFVEFGELTLTADDKQLGLAAGKYVALLSHSGSRGAGAAVCSTYSQTAQRLLPKKYKDLGRLAWLDLDERSRPGVLGRDEPDGRIRRGESCGDPSAGVEAAGGGDRRGRGEPPQLCLEGAASWSRSDRASQGRDAGR